MGGAIGRFGFALDIRPHNRFALHPEVTVTRGFKSGDPTLYQIGMGFNFGTLPVLGPQAEANDGS